MLEIAGIAIAAIAFADQSIKTGSALFRFAGDSSSAGRKLVNVTVRLEAQRYTLQLWLTTWQRKSEADTKESYVRLWGERGYMLIIQCLAQINIKLGEAQRTLTTIDQDSLRVYGLLGIENQAREPDLEDRLLQAPEAPPPTSRRRRFFRRFLGSRKPHDDGSRIPAHSGHLDSHSAYTEQTAEATAKEIQSNLHTGTKVRWSLGVKEELRLILGEIDEWIQQLQILATQCESEKLEADSRAAPDCTVVRRAAKALYKAASRNTPGPSRGVNLKLEREWKDSRYFDRVFGPVRYLDKSDGSLKFPLLVLDRVQKLHYLLLAEACQVSSIGRVMPHFEEQSFDEILVQLSGNTDDSESGSRSIMVIGNDGEGLIVIHPITEGPTMIHSSNATLSPPECSFREFLAAHTSVDPLISMWKRLQLACTVAVSVLHLYETGWISERLKGEDIHFFNTPSGTFHEQMPISPFISLPNCKGVAQEAVTSHPTDRTPEPFDCLKHNLPPDTDLLPRNERLATLFHQLGIILFELGSGRKNEDIPVRRIPDAEGAGIYESTDPLESKLIILEEIEKIPFGKPYRDLVKLCLTGCVYHDIQTMGFDSHFTRSVIHKLVNLEKHFKSIIHGDETNVMERSRGGF